VVHVWTIIGEGIGVLEWIQKTYMLTRTGDEILFPIDSAITILTPVTAFTGFFEDAITAAIAAGTDPRQAILTVDPSNTLGFNDYV
jgi:hypothetical protein